MTDFYVYAWLRPCGTPFYIGKGRRKRDVAQKHKNEIFSRIVEKIRKGGIEPAVVRLSENLSEEAAFELERAQIKQLGRINLGTGVLANMTDGGEGKHGAVASPETRAKMSRALKGRKLSPEQRLKLSIAHRGKIIPEEQREKLRRANLGKRASPETRAKQSASLRGREISAETIAKRVRKLTGLKRDKTAKLAMSRAQHMSKPRSGFKGVFLEEGRFRARISVGGKSQSLGRFASEKDAAKAYDRAAYAAWGTECYLNFPEDMDRA